MIYKHNSYIFHIICKKSFRFKIFFLLLLVISIHCSSKIWKFLYCMNLEGNRTEQVHNFRSFSKQKYVHYTAKITKKIYFKNLVDIITTLNIILNSFINLILSYVRILFFPQFNYMSNSEFCIFMLLLFFTPHIVFLL